MIMRNTFLALIGLIAFTATQAQEISGSLSPGDMRRDNAYFYDAHTVRVTQPTILRVGLSSEDFDTYLIVKTPDGQELLNDDFAENSDSYIEILAESPGAYTIWASSYEEGAAGSYSLLIEQSGAISIDRTEGRLDPKDEMLPKGEHIDTYTRTIKSKSPFSVRLQCYGFDGYLVVTSPSGQVFRNDDADDNDVAISRVSDLTPEEGQWKIQVTSAAAAEVGAYDLEIITEN